jgi:DNA-binding NarL/FixJ family response regulator
MNYNVLLVEDNSSFRQTLADTLLAHFATMNIAEAGSGEDALIKVEELHPDMIFMDINLPGENGLEATRKIKIRYEHTLIAMLTSYDIPEYRQQAFRNGADYFISKSDDACLVDIIAWVEKAMADKNTQTSQENTSASRRVLWRQRMSTATVWVPNSGLDLAAWLL